MSYTAGSRKIAAESLRRLRAAQSAPRPAPVATDSFDDLLAADTDESAGHHRAGLVVPGMVANSAVLSIVGLMQKEAGPPPLIFDNDDGRPIDDGPYQAWLVGALKVLRRYETQLRTAHES